MALVSTAAFALEPKWDEGDLVGYPAIFSESGQRLGSGSLTQKLSGNHLSVRNSYSLSDGRKIVETAEFEVKPKLNQLAWSFEEKRGDAVLRRYQVDFPNGHATGEKHEGSDVKRYDEKVKVKPGETFAGLGFVFAAKNLLGELKEGPRELTAIAFTPKPRSVTVQLTRASVDTLTSGGNSVKASRVVIHPKVPAVARAFVHPKDAVMWFAEGNPPQFLRSEATIAEPEEQVVQINLFGSSSRIGRRGATR